MVHIHSFVSEFIKQTNKKKKQKKKKKIIINTKFVYGQRKVIYTQNLSSHIPGYAHVGTPLVHSQVLGVS